MSDQASLFHQLIEWAEENDAPDYLTDLKEFGRFHKPVCVKCQIGMRVDLNGVAVIDTFQDPPKPYQLWSADQWICPVCGHKIINGFSNVSIQHFQGEFAERLKLAKEQPHVYSFEKVRHAEDFIAVNSGDLVKGKWVDIYQKPYTGEDFEGRAKLVGQIEWPGADPSAQRWLVKFKDEEEFHERIIVTWFANASYES
jgi:glycine cleavage system H lipoate-binding protein